MKEYLERKSDFWICGEYQPQNPMLLLKSVHRK